MLDCTKQTSSDHVESHLQLNSIVNSSFFFSKNFKGNCFIETTQFLQSLFHPRILLLFAISKENILIELKQIDQEL